MATPHRQAPRRPNPNEVNRRYQECHWEPLDTSGSGPGILELPTKDLSICPSVDIEDVDDGGSCMGYYVDSMKVIRM
ncbi:jg17284 [Pararge aegeria aegeria]|uniref:Jg17284 protein n=1 Tax=Pararge aegeria aegeria TaxID=348720 RepID=A0A8S4R0Z2_9NEOP|nr:jg17284 [Pararge aegeria aegeria]